MPPSFEAETSSECRQSIIGTIPLEKLNRPESGHSGVLRNTPLAPEQSKPNRLCGSSTNSPPPPPPEPSMFSLRVHLLLRPFYGLTPFYNLLLYSSAPTLFPPSTPRNYQIPPIPHKPGNTTSQTELHSAQFLPRACFNVSWSASKLLQMIYRCFAWSYPRLLGGVANASDIKAEVYIVSNGHIRLTARFAEANFYLDFTGAHLKALRKFAALKPRAPTRRAIMCERLFVVFHGLWGIGEIW